MKTNRIFLAVGAMALTLMSCRESTVSVESPGNEIVVSVDMIGDTLKMCVSKNGRSVLADCRLGLTVDGRDIGAGAAPDGKVTKETYREEYAMYGNHSRAVNHYSEISVPMKSGPLKYKLIVRAYDDGVAVRYVIPAAKGAVITSDNTSFPVDASSLCFWAEYADSNEELHNETDFARIPEGQAIVAPMTIRAGEYYMAFTEAVCIDFPDMSWIKQGGAIKANFTTNPGGWTNEQEDIVSPWRTVIIADDLTQLVNSDMVTNLSPAPKAGTDFSWVKPGRVLWQWWSVGAPKYEDQKNWYDAAARLTWEYYLVDDGWRDWKQPGKDQWQCLKDVIDYGKTVGVESLVWVNSEEMRDVESVHTYLNKVKEAGAKGIKIDFIPPATPQIMKWYEQVREETYALKLMCNFHGCVKPSGSQRTWPHELTREGVRGDEWQMTRYDRLLPWNQDAIVPFTRLIAGPADFTPVIFDKKEIRGYTWAHQLSQAVVYCSPLTHFADDYRNYIGNPAEDVLKIIPTVWDKTIVLPCSEIGRVAAFAKRKGDRWWIGIMNGALESDITFALDFLTGDASAIILADDVNPASFSREEKTVRKGEIFTMNLQPGGGFVMVLKNDR